MSQKDYRETYDNLYLLIQNNYFDSWCRDEDEDLSYEHIPEKFANKSGWGCLLKDLKPLTKQDCLDLIDWVDNYKDERYIFNWDKEDKKKYEAIKASLKQEERVR